MGRQRIDHGRIRNTGSSGSVHRRDRSVRSPTAGAATQAGGGFLAGFAKAQPWLAVAAFGFELWSKSEARVKAKEDARDSTAVKIKDVQTIDQNETAVILYGVTATKGKRVFLRKNPGDRIPLMPSGLPSVGRMPFDQQQADRTTRRVRCNPWEFLFMQYVLSVGECDDIIDLVVDGRRSDWPWTTRA